MTATPAGERIALPSGYVFVTASFAWSRSDRFDLIGPEGRPIGPPWLAQDARAFAAALVRPAADDAALADVERLFRTAVAMARNNPPGSDCTAQDAQDRAAAAALDAIRVDRATLRAQLDTERREGERLKMTASTVDNPGDHHA